MPVVLSMVVSLIYNMADTYFISRTGSTSLVAGVSLVTPVFTFMIAVGDIFGLGGSSVISRLFGKKEYATGKRLSVFCFYAAFLCGILIAVMMLIFREPILHLLGTDRNTMEFASSYYLFIVLGAPFIIVSYTPANLLRTEGYAKASMAGTVLGAVVNILLDPLLIFTFGLGSAGAAIATVIGNICTDLYFVWFLMTKSKLLSVVPMGIPISIKEMGQILAIGIPASITNLMQSIGIAMTNRYLLPYGNDKVAAMGIALKVNMIAVLILVGFAFGGQPLIGYNYGSRNRSRLKQILKFAYGLECGIALLLSLMIGYTAPKLVAFFMHDTKIVTAGASMLRLQVGSMVFVGIVLVTTCIFQSMGKALGAFVLSACRQGAVLAVILVIFSRVMGYQGVICAQPISDCLTALLAGSLLIGTIRRE
ncbi:MATE family efflux transporter [Enterocloster bolteae]|nr:MATE family efflux transporter [Enterocloster bolteae]MCQ5144451.1 MATE family efflux transporter [Enterocloster bolteae]